MKTIINYSTKQKGYGRQGLYVDIQFNNLVFNNIYVEDVFPNLGEQFLLEEHAFWDEDKEIHHDDSGQEFEEVFKTTLDYVKSIVDFNDLEIEAYAICDNANGKYLSNQFSDKWCNLEENAFLFKSEEDAFEHYDEFDSEKLSIVNLW